VGGKPPQVRLTTFYSENNPPKHELFVTVKKPRLSMRKYLKEVGVTSQQTIERVVREPGGKGKIKVKMVLRWNPPQPCGCGGDRSKWRRRRP
jgi:hypothetical protein